MSVIKEKIRKMESERTWWQTLARLACGDNRRGAMWRAAGMAGLITIMLIQMRAMD